MKQSRHVYKILLILVFLIGIILTLGNFLSIYKNFNNGRSLDLRNRIVGTRVALLHFDPYTYNEQPQGDIKLIDPFVFPSASLTKLSVTPVALLPHIILSFISFSKITYFWFFIEWFALFFAIYLSSRTMKYQKKSLVWLIGLLFSGSLSWALHLHFGQIYVLYVLLLALILYTAYYKKYYLAFVLIGILVLARPPYIFIPMLLFSVKKFRVYFRPFIYGVASVGIVSMIVFNSAIWLQYLDGMIMMTKVPANIERTANIPQRSYVEVIEGWSVPQQSLGFSPEYETSIRGFVFKKFEYIVSPAVLFSIIIFINMAALIIINNKGTVNFVTLYGLAVTIAIVTEYFIPARRYMYADVQWIIPLVVAIMLFKPVWLKGLRKVKT